MSIILYFALTILVMCGIFLGIRRLDTQEPLTANHLQRFCGRYYGGTVRTCSVVLTEVRRTCSKC